MLHRLSDDHLFKALSDFLDPKTFSDGNDVKWNIYNFFLLIKIKNSMSYGIMKLTERSQKDNWSKWKLYYRIVK